MKAKRLLSAFVAVAMMATMFVAFSTVTFAAVKPTVDVQIVPMTDEEFAAIQTESTCAAADGTKGYWLVGTVSDYGTLKADEDVTNGRKLQGVGVRLTFADDVTNYIEYTSKMKSKLYKLDKGDIGTAALAQYSMNTKELQVTFTATEAASTYPVETDVDYTDTITWCKLPLYVKAVGTEATLTYAETAITTFDWETPTSQEAYYLQSGTMNVANANLTLGSSAPAVVTPDVAAGEEAATGYDNAFAVKTDITPGSATEIGVLFAPDFWLGSKELKLDLEGAAKASMAATGAGTVTLKAAIRDIPWALKGAAFKMVTRAYATGELVTQYADAVETDYTAFAE